MTNVKMKLGVRALAWTSALGILPASGELPTLSEKKWLGHFIGFENKKFGYGFTVHGRSLIKVNSAKGEPLTPKLTIHIEFLVEEILPNGKFYIWPMVPESLESLQLALKDPKNVVIRGEVKNGIGFEVSVDENHGVISLGGRVVNQGAVMKNPVRFAIRVIFPNAYPYTKRGGDQKQAQAFKEKIRSDRMAITWTDGKRVKWPTDQVIDADSEDVNGSGISALQVDFSSYDGKKIGCVASANSVMRLSSKQAGPLHDGFVLTWIADAVKDLNGQAKLSFEVR